MRRQRGGRSAIAPGEEMESGVGPFEGDEPGEERDDGRHSEAGLGRQHRDQLADLAVRDAQGGRELADEPPPARTPSVAFAFPPETRRDVSVEYHRAAGSP